MPTLLDLFCCEGGAALGYRRAGFDVVGVDVKPQPRYPFEFVQADAMTFPLDGFDAVHASPPCQAYSVTKHSHGRSHPDLIGLLLARFAELSTPWVIENVPGAPLPSSAVELCGAAMRCVAVDDDGSLLVLRRHRLFASNVPLTAPPCACAEFRRAGVQVAGVYGGGGQRRGANANRGGYTPRKRVRAELIGAHHMSRDGLSQAIPPSYTEHVGAQLLRTISDGSCHARRDHARS